MENLRLQNLADTLSRNGLAASSTEAIRMAESIIGTEKRVAKHFDKENEKIDKELTVKRTYKEEVDYLIDKTSPEKKDFHIPIKGYQKDVIKVEPEVSNELEEPSISIEEEPQSLAEPLVEEPDIEEDSLLLPEVKEPVKEIVEIPLPMVKEAVDEPIEPLKPGPIAKPQIEKPVPEAKKDIKPVFTNAFDDDRTLKELMNEDAESVYNQPGRVVIEESSEKFIDDTEQEDTGESTSLSNEPADTDDSVDLMDYFKFG